eukprot:scaffold2914_cov156-Ochromonas_danica.AAC.18
MQDSVHVDLVEQPCGAELGLHDGRNISSEVGQVEIVRQLHHEAVVLEQHEEGEAHRLGRESLVALQQHRSCSNHSLQRALLHAHDEVRRVLTEQIDRERQRALKTQWGATTRTYPHDVSEVVIDNVESQAGAEGVGQR